jgi:hypothetical protein
MSDKKTHTLQLGNAPKEEVTDAEMAAVKQATGQRFYQYDVQPIQPEKPADLTAPKPGKQLPAAPVAADKPE